MAEVEVRHTLMREDMSLVNAAYYGTGRTSAALWAALADIASARCVLALFDVEDGLWVIDADVTIPANVTLLIAAGATLTGTGNLTVLGGLQALRADWWQSSGTCTWQGSQAPLMAATLLSGALALGLPQGPQVTLQSPQGMPTPWTLTLPPGPGSVDQVLATDGTGASHWQTVQGADPLLSALAGLTTANNQTLFFTGPDAPALTTLTPLARTLLDDPSVADMQTTLLLIPGTHVQPYDATLTAFAGLAGSANTMPYFSSPDQLTLTALSPYSRTLFDDPDAVTWRATLGLKALAILDTVGTPQIDDRAVTYAKMQTMTGARLLGRSAGAPGPVQEISTGPGLTLSSGGVLDLSGTAIAGTGLANKLGVWSGTSSLTYHTDVHWDMTNARLGIGTNNPTEKLHVIGNILTPSSVFAGSSLFVKNIYLQDASGNTNPPGDPLVGYACGINYVAGQYRLCLNMSGSAHNYLFGNTGIGTASRTDTKLAVSGGIIADYIAINSGLSSARLVVTGDIIWGSGNLSYGWYPARQNLDVAGSAGVNTLDVRQFMAVGGKGIDSVIGLALQFNKGGGQHGFVTYPTGADGGAYDFLFCNVAGASVGSILTNATSTNFGTSSDVRLKEAIVPLAGAVERLQAMRPVAFRWQIDSSPGEGFIAHELQTVIPLAVTGQPNEVNPDGSIKPQQVDQSKLVPWLVSALQVALTQVQDLNARLTALETALN